MKTWKRVVVGAALAGITLGAGLQGAQASTTTASPTAATSAASQGGSCHTEVQSEWTGSWGDRYRVVAWCDSIDRGTQVRGVLDIPWSVDEYTDWFTTPGKTYASDWRYGTLGVEPDSRIEYAQMDKVAPAGSLTFPDGSSQATIQADDDATVHVTLPEDATGTMYFQVVHADGSISDLAPLPITPGTAGYEYTIAGQDFEPGANWIKGYYSGDAVYNAYSPVLSANVV